MFTGTADADLEWYNDNFGEWTKFPLFDRDEAIRLGVMENGREIDQPNYWDKNTSEKARLDYIKHWTPQLDKKQLAANWVTYGGMDKFEPEKVTVTAGGVAYYQTSVGKVKFKNYDVYREVLPYWRDIRDASIAQGINTNVLLAVLIYESNYRRKKGGHAYDVVSSLADGEGASLGLPQLEVYKARAMLVKNAKAAKEKEYWKNAHSSKVANILLTKNNIPKSIHLAA